MFYSIIRRETEETHEQTLSGNFRRLTHQLQIFNEKYMCNIHVIISMCCHLYTYSESWGVSVDMGFQDLWL